MSSSNLVQISSIEETVYGVTPSTGNFETVRYTSESLSGTPQTATSAEIQSDRTAGGQIQVGLDVGGDINTELSADPVITHFIQGAMMQSNVVAPSVATGVAITVSAIDKTLSFVDAVDFVKGDLLVLSGFVQEKNNGIAYVKDVAEAEVTPAVLKDKITSTHDVAVEFKVDFTIAGGGAGVWSYGDDAVTENADGTFTYAAVGTYQVKFTADSDGTVSNIALQVVALADTPKTQVGLDEIKTPAVMSYVVTVAKETIASETSPTTASITRSAKTSIGTDIVSFSLSKQFNDLTDKSIAYTGMIINQMNIAMAYGSIANSTFSFLGNGYDTPATPITDGRVINDAGIEQPFNASSDVGLVIVDGEVADFCIQNLSIQLANGLTPQTCMGNLAPRQYALGTAMVTVSGSAYLSDENWKLMAKKLSQTPVSIAYTVENDDGGIAVVVHGAQLSFPDPSSKGMDSQVSIEFSGTAKGVENGYFDIYTW